MPKKKDAAKPLSFEQCMAQFRKHNNVQAQEDAYFYLLPLVREYATQLLAELDIETDPWAQSWLLELLSETHDIRAFPVFVTYLLTPSESLRCWAVWGLRGLAKTREGRRLLWEARRYRTDLPVLIAEEDYEKVLAEIASVLDG